MPGKAAAVHCVPYDPAFLMSPENFPEPSYLSDKFIPFSGLVVGGLGAIAHNMSKRRPYLAGLPYILGAAVGGLAVGIFIQNRNDAYWAENDAVFRHYISLHPEDFPARERILIGDMFQPWCPIR